MKKISYFIIFTLLIITFAAQATVEKIGSNTVEITLPRDYDRGQSVIVPLRLINSGAAAQPVYFELSSFVSAEKQPAEVQLFAAGRDEPLLRYTGAAVMSDSLFTFKRGESRAFQLQIRLASLADEYSGTFAVHSLPAGQQSPQVETESITITIRRYQPPEKVLPKTTLLLHHGSEQSMYIRRNLWDSQPEMSDFSINVSNTSETDSLHNLLLKPISVIRKVGEDRISERFEPNQYTKTVAALAAKSSANIALPFPPLHGAGTYTVTFGIEADNLEPQQFSAQAHIKYNALYAALIILLGSVLSYSLTRGFINLKKRGDRKIHIRNVRTETEDLTEINITIRERIRALASVAADLNRKFFFNNNDMTQSFLEIADYLIDVSQRRERIWKTLLNNDAPPGLVEQVKDHFKEVDRLAMKYDVLAHKNEIKTQLDEAEKCTTSEKGTAYAANLKRQISNVLERHPETPFPASDRITTFHKKLRQQLTAMKDRETIPYSDLATAEIMLRMFRLLTEYNIDAGLLEQAIDSFNSAETAENGLQNAMKIAFWDMENKRIWERILKYKDSITISLPLKPASNEVTIFSIDFGSDDLNNSYLVRKILDYHWSFTPAGQYKLSKPLLDSLPVTKRVRYLKREFPTQAQFKAILTPLLETESQSAIRDIIKKAKTPAYKKIPVPPSNDMKSNSLAKYFPEHGEYDISVSISIPDEYLPDDVDKNMTAQFNIQQQNIEVRPNEDIRWYHQWNKYEIGLSAIVFLFAVFSGLQSQHFQKPDFGSWDDFMMLFIWAVGFDQGKNFLTVLKDLRDKQAAAGRQPEK